ncbi:MAG: class I SAM-dependent methyltransferase [Candidatus Omnitrophica bacterium]|nr:class I SAM-dependent methyltransferase [Candidatus Omnitrophota bacterium]
MEESFLDLGVMPLANSFLEVEEVTEEEFKCPLSLSYCSVCGLIQLAYVVPPDLMFSNYLYVSSTTQTFREHFAGYAKAVKERVLKKSNIVAVDIGSNDGLLLACYQREGIKAIGVEPAKNLSDVANYKGLTTINRYFDSECVEKILRDYGPADVVSANNVFAHIDNIHAVCQNVQKLLAVKGIFVIEFPYLITMVEKMLFDMIYHEHLSYISITALNYLLEKHELEIFQIHQVPSHGGSLRVFIQKRSGGYKVSKAVALFVMQEERNGYRLRQTYQVFAQKMARLRGILAKMVMEIKSAGGSISGYGAPAKANTLINYCGFTRSQIDYIVDDNPLKQGKLSPGAKIPIVSSSYLTQKPTNYIMIFAWNFAQEIIRKLQRLGSSGVKFIIPLPDPEIV